MGTLKYFDILGVRCILIDTVIDHIICFRNCIKLLSSQHWCSTLDQFVLLSDIIGMIFFPSCNSIYLPTYLSIDNASS
jgi:hypothetical protein